MLRHHEAFNGKVCESLYVSGVRSADRWFGHLVKHLKRLKLYDNTMIILTSDHGEEMQDHNKKAFYNVHGHILYEEMIHVPLVIKLPKNYKGGTRTSLLARTVDIMPTILDFFSLNPKKDEMQGESLRSYWREPKSTPNRVAYTEACARKNEKKSLRTRRYKYILSIDKQSVAQNGRSFIPEMPKKTELYNLENDPKEKRNLLRNNPGTLIRKVSKKFDKQLRKHIKAQQGRAEPTVLDQSTLEKLKSLGYIGN